MAETQLDLAVSCPREGCDWKLERTWRESGIDPELAGRKTRHRLAWMLAAFRWHLIQKHMRSWT